MDPVVRGVKVRPMSTQVRSQVQVHLRAGAATRTARLCLSSDLWSLGIAVIGARSIAQEISRGADGCKGLVNHSKIRAREGEAKLQQRVAVGRCCNGSCDHYGGRCFPKPKKWAQGHSGP